MKLKVGDVVEFKKYEDIDYDERVLLSEEKFPKSGKVKEVITAHEKDLYFSIEESPYWYSTGSVARVISGVDDIDIDSLKPGDEVLMKVTVGEIRENYIWVSWVDKSDIVKVLKRKEERFIVQEDRYKMYVINSKSLSLDKSKAKIYTSRNTANEEAADMHLNAWEVIPYDA